MMEDVFNFTKDTESYVGSEGELVARVGDVRNEDELYSKLYTGLNFPDYFDFDWGRLDSWLTDLRWIDAKKVTLVHDGTMRIKSAQFEVYIGLLHDTVLTWRHRVDSKIDFEVFFLNKHKKKVLSALTQQVDRCKLLTPHLIEQLNRNHKL